MLRIDRILKSWNESGSLNAQINLYGFWNDEVLLTKSGDLGIVLRVRGVDYESLDQAAQEYAVKRLEAALKIFGPGFHVYWEDYFIEHPGAVDSQQRTDRNHRRHGRAFDPEAEHSGGGVPDRYLQVCGVFRRPTP